MALGRSLGDFLGQGSSRGLAVGARGSAPFVFTLAPADGAGMGTEGAGTDITSAQGLPITITRASVAYGTKADGTLFQVAANKPRVCSVGGVLSLFLESVASTNLCLWSSKLTDAVWTKSNMTTAFTATHPDGTANAATTCTATAGNATVLQTITSASSSKTVSVYIKRRTGSGTINVTRNNGTTWVDVTSSVSSSWARIGYQTSTSLGAASIVNPVVGIRIVTSGDAVDVALFQCETVITSFAQTSPIETNASTAARAAEDATVTLPFAQSTAGWCMRGKFTPEYIWSLQNGSVGFFQFGTPTASMNTTNFLINSATGQVIARVYGTNAATPKAYDKTGVLTVSNATGHTFQAAVNNLASFATMKFDGVDVGALTQSGTGNGFLPFMPTLVRIGALSSGGNNFRGWVNDIVIANDLTSAG